MSRYYVWLILLFGAGFPCSAQLNVQLLHQLVAESKSEHRRQQEARNQQSYVTVTEQLNKDQMSTLKDRYRRLQTRFKTLGLVMNIAQVGIQAGPVLSEILDQQRLIFEQAYRKPVLISLAYDAERELSGKAVRLMNFIYGLVLSFGDLHQMKARDRRMLFGYVLSELKSIAGTSRGLAVTMSYSSGPNLQFPFADFTEEDKVLVKNILRNIR